MGKTLSLSVKEIRTPANAYGVLRALQLRIRKFSKNMHNTSLILQELWKLY